MPKLIVKPGDTFTTIDPETIAEQFIFLGEFFCKITKIKINKKSVTSKDPVVANRKRVFIYNIKDKTISSVMNIEVFNEGIDTRFSLIEKDNRFQNIEENAKEVGLYLMRDMITDPGEVQTVTGVSVKEEDLDKSEVDSLKYFTKLFSKRGKTRVVRELKNKKYIFPIERI